MTQNRIALYSRVSGQEQAKHGFSPEQQIRDLHKWAEINGWRVVAEYTELGHSAFSEGMERPELQKMMRAASKRMFDAIIFVDLSRFTRDVADGILLYRHFKQCGVRIISRDEGEITEDNQLIFILTNYQNSQYVEQIRRKSMANYRAKVKSGIYSGGRGAPYGYEIQGRKRSTRLVVYEERAIVVRMIYKWYALEGYTVTEIVDMLSKQRIKTPGEILGHRRKRSSGTWTPDTIKSILRNETYAGVAYAMKTKKVNGKTIPLKKEVNNDDQWVAIEVPAIVSRDLWNLANERMDKGQYEASRHTKHSYLLGRRIRCLRCGRSMTGMKGYKSHTYYRCNTTRRDTAEPYCGTPHIRGDMVDALVWQWIQRLVTEPKAVMQGYKEAQKEMNRRASTLIDQRKVLLEEHKQRSQQLDRLIDLYERGSIPIDLLDRRATEHKEILAGIAERIERLNHEIESITISDDDIVTLIGSLEQYRESLDDDLANATPEVQRSFLEALGLYFQAGTEDGVVVVYITWLYNRFRVAMISGDSENSDVFSL